MARIDALASDMGAWACLRAAELLAEDLCREAAGNAFWFEDSVWRPYPHPRCTGRWKSALAPTRTLSPSHPLTLSPSHSLTLSPSHHLTISPSQGR